MGRNLGGIDCQQNVALLKSREERGIYGNLQASNSSTRLVEDIEIAEREEKKKKKNIYIYIYILRVFSFKYFFFFN